MAHPALQQPLSRRAQMMQEPQAGLRGSGLDLASLVGMLTHLYGLSQQQQQAPGQIEHMNLENQLARMQLQNAPEDAKQKRALEQAQIDQLNGKNQLHQILPFLPEGPDKELALDQLIPARVAAREEAQRQKDLAQWPQLIAGARLGNLPQGADAAHWGEPAMDHLRKVMGEAPPPPQPELPGAGPANALRAIGSIPQRLQNADTSMGNYGMNFWKTLFGVDTSNQKPMTQNEQVRPWGMFSK